MLKEQLEQALVPVGDTVLWLHGIWQLSGPTKLCVCQLLLLRSSGPGGCSCSWSITCGLLDAQVSMYEVRDSEN